MNRRENKKITRPTKLKNIQKIKLVKIETKIKTSNKKDTAQLLVFIKLSTLQTIFLISVEKEYSAKLISSKKFPKTLSRGNTTTFSNLFFFTQTTLKKFHFPQNLFLLKIIYILQSLLIKKINPL